MYTSIRFCEFIFAICILFIFFSYTNQIYWTSGTRTALQTATGSFVFVVLYEIFLWYLPLTAITWIAVSLTGSIMLTFVSVPIIFFVHSIEAYHLLHWRFTWMLGAVIGVMTIVDAVLSWAFVVRRHIQSSPGDT